MRCEGFDDLSQFHRSLLVTSSILDPHSLVPD